VTRAAEEKELLTELNELRSLAEEFLALVQEQSGFIAAGDLSSFRNSTKRRLSLTEDMRGRVDSTSALVGDASEEAAALRGEIGGIFAEILSTISENETAAKAKLSELKLEVEKLEQSKKGVSGYGQNLMGGRSPRFDKKY
jgi:hypothetical protein